MSPAAPRRVASGCGIPRQHAAGLWSIAVPTPWPVGPVNVYVLAGPRPALIDCGPRGDQAQAALAAGLAALGWQVADLGAILLTHGHFDHAGAALLLARQSGARLYGHPGLRAALRPRGVRWGAARLAFLRRCGLAPGLLPGLRAAWRGAATYAELAASPPRLRALAEGDVLDWGAFRLTALETPGHVPEHLSFMLSARAAPPGPARSAMPGAALSLGPWLVAGDALLPNITPNPTLAFARRGHRVRSLQDQEATLRRLATLGRLRVLPGHGQPLADSRRVAHHDLTAIERRSAALLAWLRRQPGSGRGPAGARQPGRPGLTPAELAQALFGPLHAGNAFLAVSEVLGHLDRLAAASSLRVAWRADPIRVSLMGTCGGAQPRA